MALRFFCVAKPPAGRKMGSHGARRLPPAFISSPCGAAIRTRQTALWEACRNLRRSYAKQLAKMGGLR